MSKCVCYFAFLLLMCLIISLLWKSKEERKVDMIKAEYGIKAANLVWLIWDNTKKSPSCLFHWMTGGGFWLLHCKFFVIALQKLFYCIAKAMLLHCKSYVITW